MTHLVSENTVDSLFVQVGEPIKTFELILFERSGEHFGLSDNDISASRRVLEIEIISVN